MDGKEFLSVRKTRRIVANLIKKGQYTVGFVYRKASCRTDGTEKDHICTMLVAGKASCLPFRVKEGHLSKW
jgi:hypothetical protein